MKKATNEQIVNAYLSTGSVWKAGKLLGLCGQSVQERLRAIGHQIGNRPWTDDELAEAADLSRAGVRLAEIASRLGRTYGATASQLSLMGVRNARPREKKIPRAAGYDKASIGARMAELDAYDGPVTRYARANGLSVELLIKAIQKYDQAWWDRYVATHADLPAKVCVYCEATFYPANHKQTYCDRKCGADARADRSYFGGRRRATLGLAEGICQLCGRTVGRGLSSHHVLGKENDPDNEVLIALCSGCHKAITFLASRTFVDDPLAWQSLISLAYMRRHGDQIASGALDGQALYVEVHIESEPDDEAADIQLWGAPAAPAAPALFEPSALS